MSDNAFDRQIRHTLENLEPPFDPTTWDALQQKLDAANAAPAAEEAPAPPPSRGTVTEQQIADFLRDFEVGYQPADWNLLSQQMDHRAEVRRIRLHKAAEAVLMLLLLANLQSVLTGSAKLFRMPVPAAPQPVEKPANRPIASNRHGHGLASAVVVEPSVATPGQLAAEHTIVPETTLVANVPVTLDVILANGQPAESVPQGIANQLIGPDGQPLPAGLRPLTLLAMLGLDQFATQQPAATTLAAAVRVPTTKANPSVGERLYAQIFAGWERNHTQFADASASSTNPGNSAGVLVGARRGKWGVEGGVAYARRSYNTEKEIITFRKTGPNSAVGTSLDGVRADFVAVPVRATRQLAHLGRTKVVAAAGATANFAMGKKYRFREYNMPLPPNQVPGIGQPDATLPVAESLLNGGNLADNFYATADLALRVEQPVTRRLTAFVEPVYSRAVTPGGFGPKSARTHSVAVQAGVMAAL